MNVLTYQGKNLLLRVHLAIKQLDDPLHLAELLEKIDLTKVALDSCVVGILQRDTLESEHLAVLCGHSIHLATTTSAQTVQASVGHAIHPQDVASLLGLRRRGSAGCGCGRL